MKKLLDELICISVAVLSAMCLHQAYLLICEILKGIGL
jgi:hypothetical protein